MTMYLLSTMLPVVPDYQPVPLPAPLWLLQTLLVLGFFLHAIPMNVAFVGGLVSANFLNQAKGDTNHYAHRIGHSIAYSLPLFISFAITQGIVPLLFLQLIYGPLYYSSSVLMAWPWVGLLTILLIGYYLAYFYKNTNPQFTSLKPGALVIVTLLFSLVGFLFTSNMTLMLHPEKWPAIMAAQYGGAFLHTDDPTILPRFLHMVVGAFAVTGLLIGCHGLYWLPKEKEYGQWLIKTGSGLYLLPTLLQIGVGGWFMMTLPREHMMNYMGQDQFGTIAFGVSMLLMLLSVVTGALAWKNGSGGPFKLSLVTGLLTVLAMSLMRHLLRVYTTTSFLKPELLPVNTQWDLLIAFIITAVLLIIYLTWLVKLAWKANNPVSA